MTLRIFIFDQDAAVRGLLRTYLSSHGHTVHAFPDLTTCNLSRHLDDQNSRCSQAAPCGDVVLIDHCMPLINAFSFLQLQRERGCKVLDANKAVMSTSLSPAMKNAMQEFGCHYIAKPFRLEAVGRWIEECASRVNRS
jgi:DNA-binding NtrC family response regulator